MSRFYSFLTLIVGQAALPLLSWAGTIKGRVTDARPGEPLVGQEQRFGGSDRAGPPQPRS